MQAALGLGGRPSDLGARPGPARCPGSQDCFARGGEHGRSGFADRANTVRLSRKRDKGGTAMSVPRSRCILWSMSSSSIELAPGSAQRRPIRQRSRLERRLAFADGMRAKKTAKTVNHKWEYLWGNAAGDIWLQRPPGRTPVNLTNGVSDGSGLVLAAVVARRALPRDALDARRQRRALGLGSCRARDSAS